MTLVLDNEAAQALADPAHRKHKVVLAFHDGLARRARRTGSRTPVLLPTVVRVEAGLDRTDPRTSSLGRLRIVDVTLDSSRADAAARLRRTAGGSAVDACVAELAASLDGSVTVLTADLTDLPALLSAAGSDALVHRV